MNKSRNLQQVRLLFCQWLCILFPLAAAVQTFPINLTFVQAVVR